jgi:hypothetical protein
MTKFPVDALIERILAALERLGFHVVRIGNHIALLRDNPDGTSTPFVDYSEPSTDQKLYAAHHVEPHRYNPRRVFRRV